MLACDFARYHRPAEVAQQTPMYPPMSQAFSLPDAERFFQCFSPAILTYGPLQTPYVFAGHVHEISRINQADSSPREVFVTFSPSSDGLIRHPQCLVVDDSIGSTHSFAPGSRGIPRHFLPIDSQHALLMYWRILQIALEKRGQSHAIDFITEFKRLLLANVGSLSAMIRHAIRFPDISLCHDTGGVLFQFSSPEGCTAFFSRTIQHASVISAGHSSPQRTMLRFQASNHPHFQGSSPKHSNSRKRRHDDDGERCAKAARYESPMSPMRVRMRMRADSWTRA